MGAGDIIDFGVQAIWLILKCSAPMLISSLVIGLIVSVFQTVTSIQEQTLTFVPKLIVVMVVLIICGDWILNNIVQYIKDVCASFSSLI